MRKPCYSCPPQDAAQDPRPRLVSIVGPRPNHRKTHSLWRSLAGGRPQVGTSNDLAEGAPTCQRPFPPNIIEEFGRYPPTYLTTYLPAFLLACLLDNLLPTCLPTGLPTYIPSYPPTQPPTRSPTAQSHASTHPCTRKDTKHGARHKNHL